MDDSSFLPHPLSVPGSAVPLSPSAYGAPPRKAPWYSWRRWGWNFLTVSILVHVLFGMGAAYYIVAIIQAKPKPVFKAPGAAGPNAPNNALEHKVQMAKKQNSMSAPVAAKRITTTSLSKVALPALPAMKMDAVVLPTTMSGMGGTGAGLGGFGNGGGGGGGGGGGFSLFGLRTRPKGGGSLVGHFFDLKQDKNRKATNMDNAKYESAIKQFVQGGFNLISFNQYYQASITLYATQIFTPSISAAEAPTAFGVQAEVQPNLWVAVYSGMVIPTQTGTYKFVGFGDDTLIVRFNHQVVLDSGYINPSGLRPSVIHTYNIYPGDWYADPKAHHAGHAEGLPFNVEAGKAYELQVLVGEEPGGRSAFQLLIKQDGVKYREDNRNNPILPVFRLEGSTLPQAGDQFPPFDTEGPIWKAEKAPPEGATKA